MELHDVITQKTTTWIFTTAKTSNLVNYKNAPLHHDWLTSWSWALLEKLPIVQLLKHFPEMYGTQRFTTVFTRALHWCLSWARSIQFTSPHPVSLRSILILSTHLIFGLPCDLFPSGFPINILDAFLSSPHSCYMPCPSRPPWLDHFNYTWRRVQVMKLLIMQYLPTSRHFISLPSKYSPHHLVLEHPQSMYLCTYRQWLTTKRLWKCDRAGSSVLENKSPEPKGLRHETSRGSLSNSSQHIIECITYFQLKDCVIKSHFSM
jgi:hypothetical protein